MSTDGEIQCQDLLLNIMPEIRTSQLRLITNEHELCGDILLSGLSYLHFDKMLENSVPRLRLMVLNHLLENAIKCLEAKTNV